MTLDGSRDREQDEVEMIDDLPFVYRKWEEPYMRNLSIMQWGTGAKSYYEVR
ncbi:hypothetical protein [Ammoniphilus sp. CFH 90114]|uniref:hypothetical protein n=1 Tax=Ammoniphilus sp. CFH 90114 TaxID=2493665 RepID=UPI0013E9697E|nr:hypothetical protein [Ammoniphilus sp. CFH 90114]